MKTRVCICLDAFFQSKLHVFHKTFSTGVKIDFFSYNHEILKKTKLRKEVSKQEQTQGLKNCRATSASTLLENVVASTRGFWQIFGIA